VSKAAPSMYFCRWLLTMCSCSAASSRDQGQAGPSVVIGLCRAAPRSTVHRTAPQLPRLTLPHVVVVGSMTAERVLWVSHETEWEHIVLYTRVQTEYATHGMQQMVRLKLSDQLHNCYLSAVREYWCDVTRRLGLGHVRAARRPPCTSSTPRTSRTGTPCSARRC